VFSNHCKREKKGPKKRPLQAAWRCSLPVLGFASGPAPLYYSVPCIMHSGAGLASPHQPQPKDEASEDAVAPLLPTRHHFAAADVDIRPFVSLQTEHLRAVEAWCAALVPERDGEEPGDGERSLLAFVRHHNMAGDLAGVWGTQCVFVRGTTEFVAMGSIVRDDRDVLRLHGLTGAGVWGGIIVSHIHRGRGVGTLLSQLLHARCQAHATATGGPATFYLYTVSAAAARIYEREAQFALVRSIIMDNEPHMLYSRTYEP
jgi:hypothetical protein